ncbi:holin [Paenibacillus sp. 1011MAR3C5]|uniref:phage holin family protein n=1 Tax=Paenibacillus sp. 1011MAR3C5 TaxID=1675787 RepID=UPI000E6B9DAF|nr:phage holin family protein [Paenibacillus sp. 1011MAR3C5]RJE88637.1 holin [Paenibacillus sp. 1011MAR3C5]
MVKQLLSTIITAVAGASGKEAAFGGAIAASGTTIAAALGGWDIALKILIFAMVFDYITGLLAAIKEKRVDSDVMLWGGIRKLVVGGVIAFAVLLDQFFGNDAPVLRTIAFYFYLGREGLSIVENLGKLNILVPDGVKDKLQQLKGKESERSDV